MMRPVEGIQEGKYYIITHKCERCGFERRNKLVAEDDFGAFIAFDRSRK